MLEKAKKEPVTKPRPATIRGSEYFEVYSRKRSAIPVKPMGIHRINSLTGIMPILVDPSKAISIKERELQMKAVSIATARWEFTTCTEAFHLSGRCSVPTTIERCRLSLAVRAPHIKVKRKAR